jgi:hypothetical protein
MERLRDQAAAAATPPATTAPVAPPVSVPVPVATPPVPTPSTPPTAALAPAATASAVAQPLQPVQNAYPPQGPYGAQSQSTYAQGQYGAQPQPTYAQGPYGAQPQPTYAQEQYGAQSQPTYPQGQYPPTYQPTAYPQGAYQPAGVATQVNPTPSSGGGRKAVAWILGVTGVGGIAAGGVFTALALNKFSTVQKKYDPAAERQGKEFATLQWVCYGAGAALLTTAVIVGATGRSSSPAVALGPAVGPGIAGATLSGSF